MMYEWDFTATINGTVTTATYDEAILAIRTEIARRRDWQVDIEIVDCLDCDDEQLPMGVTEEPWKRPDTLSLN